MIYILVSNNLEKLNKISLRYNIGECLNLEKGRKIDNLFFFIWRVFLYTIISKYLLYSSVKNVNLCHYLELMMWKEKRIEVSKLHFSEKRSSQAVRSNVIQKHAHCPNSTGNRLLRIKILHEKSRALFTAILCKQKLRKGLIFIDRSS